MGSSRDLTRLGLRSILGREPDFEIVGEASSGEVAIDLCRHKSPDIVVLDGVRARHEVEAVVSAIAKDCPRTRIVLLTTEEEFPLLPDTLRQDVDDYVFVHSTREEIVGAVRRVRRGEGPSSSARLG